jgi:hypothetical protein
MPYLPVSLATSGFIIQFSVENLFINCVPVPFVRMTSICSALSKEGALSGVILSMVLKVSVR